MTPVFAQRQVALAGVALLAAVVALVVARWNDASPVDGGTPETPWYRAVGAPYRPVADTASACGFKLKAESMGVAHPVLPCRARIVLSYEGREAITHVIDRGPSVPGRDFDITEALARELGLRGTQPIRWRFAQ